MSFQNKNYVPVGPEIQNLRNKQVSTVFQNIPSARSVAPDHSIIDIPVVVPNSSSPVTFRVTLPPAFPTVPPHVALMARATHQYLDNNSTVTHPKLARWGPHLNLGELLNEVFADFRTSPPQIMSFAPQVSPQPYGAMQPQPGVVGRPPAPGQPVYPGQPGAMGYPAAGYQPPQPGQQGYYPGMPGAQGVTQQKQPPPPPKHKTHTPMPVIPAVFPELNDKSVEELKDLIENKQAFEDFVNNLEWAKNVTQLLNDLKKGNVALAEQNLSQEQRINELKAEIASLQEQVGKQRAVFDQKAARQQEILQQYTPRVLLDKLNIATSQAEVESDEISSRFIEGDSMDINEFIKAYLEKRSLYYLRKAKKERFAKSQAY